MRMVRIYLTGNERITIYKEGGCQFERNLGKGFGWIVDNDSCRDWMAAIDESLNTMRAVRANLELVA